MAGNKRPLIRVERRHIDGAVPENSAKCMVAEAVCASIDGALRPHVDMQTIRYTDPLGIRRVMLTPASVQAALVRFDAGDPVEPFAFILPDPIHVSKPTRATKGHTKHAAERTRTDRARVRVGGRPVPILGSATRRRFGIRNLRINQQGQVVQLGTLEAEP